ncbi:hypothetical protein Noda2021_09840 [Candidatus Dependentiae bacterium Noda2021]|nr:hypothetical protein Noda2021_09840 [Candidatus Dependentiae bacterium Noda2021]
MLYAAAGFEATCSLSSRIKDADKNGPRAIFISFGIVMCVLFLFQFLLYGMLTKQLTAQASYLGVFPALIGNLFGLSGVALHRLSSLFHLAIAASALGGSYGIIYSNMWNIYTLAQHDHTLFKNYLTRYNVHAIPVACVAIEGLLMALYLYITKGTQVPLQQISAFASCIAYSLCVASLIAAKVHRAVPTQWAILVAGSASCILLGSACVRGFLATGFFPFLIFITILGLGCLMFFYTKQHNIEKKQI